MILIPAAFGVMCTLVGIALGSFFGTLAAVSVTVLSMLTALGLIGWLGIYVASILFIGFFMRWLGKYAWWKIVAVSVGNSVFFYVVFEVWFKIPLPKGPLEALLGLN